MSGNDLGMRRRRALWRATHRGSKEMDFLLGRFAEREVEAMDGAEIAAFERLIEMPDPVIEASVREGQSLADTEFDELIARMRRFHGLTPAR
jgi:antitoxin CptB